LKRLLFVSPHYPPDGAAGTHRARVLAPYLPRHGWRPTVLTVNREAYEGSLDLELEQMADDGVEVIRASALSATWTRRLGVGDLGLRALPGLRSAARRELARGDYDAIYVTTYPIYPALLAPSLKREFGVPFVLDLQDPWVGAWGASVGPGTAGAPNLKSRISRTVAAVIERRVVPHADALTSVSSELLDSLRATYPVLETRPSLELPIGLDPRDIELASSQPAHNPFFDSADGMCHVSYVGTLLPLAMDVVRVLFEGVRELRRTDPALAARLRLHFIGTSNQAQPGGPERARMIAREMGIGDLVTEHPARVPFAAALRAQLASTALLILGSTEARYTASKVAPALASGRPILAIAHAHSDALRQLRDANDATVQVIGFDDPASVRACVEPVSQVLREWLRVSPTSRPPAERLAMMSALTAPVLAGRLAGLLDRVTEPS